MDTTNTHLLHTITNRNNNINSITPTNHQDTTMMQLEANHLHLPVGQAYGHQENNHYNDYQSSAGPPGYESVAGGSGYQHNHHPREKH